MTNYKFYMQEVVWDRDTSSFVEVEDTLKDLEEDFKGLRYSKCEGLNTIGEHVVYTEEYADDNRQRVYMSDEVVNKSTEIKLTLYFVGENRQDVFDAFNEYIMRGHHTYWDSARHKKVIFYVSKSISPSADKFVGSTPYIEVTYTLNNVYGKATNV